VWKFTVRILGPDEKWRDEETVTGTLDLKAKSARTERQPLLLPSILEEVSAFQPGKYADNQWDVPACV